MEARNRVMNEGAPGVSLSDPDLPHRSFLEKITRPVGTKDMGILAGLIAAGDGVSLIFNKLTGSLDWWLTPSSIESKAIIGGSLITYFGLRKAIRGSFRRRLFLDHG